MSFDWKTMPLLERLTNMASGNYYEYDIREAIAEIVRLTAKVERLKGQLRLNEREANRMEDVVDAAREVVASVHPGQILPIDKLAEALRALDGEP